MRKRIFTLLFVLLIAVLSVMPVFASESSNLLVLDYADELTDEQEIELSDSLNEIKSKYDIEIVIDLVTGLEGYDVEVFAEAVYKENNYGCGDNKDGILFLLDTESRQWSIFSNAKGNKIFNESVREDLVSGIKSELADDDYYSAFKKFVQDCEDIIAKSNIKINSVFETVCCILVGILISAIIMLVVKSKLKSVRKQPAADTYIVPGSLAIYQSYDNFLYRNVTRTEIKRDDDDSSGGSGSSSGTF